MDNEAFHVRTRGLAESLGKSLSELADAADLPLTVVSRLLTDTDGVRRKPNVEHLFALARALGVAPRQLVHGTDAATTLAEWAPQSELDAEANERAKAQAGATRLRTELAGMTAKVKALEAALAATQKKHGEAMVSATNARIELFSRTAERDAAIRERDQLQQIAQTNYDAWRIASEAATRLEREVANAQSSASTAWICAAVGTATGTIVGAMAGQTSPTPVSKTKKLPRKRAA
jgi:transcriptional regulator with XRE-family HTH domain